MFAADVEQARPFRTKHPFMAVGGKEVDACFFHVQGEYAQTLYGIDKQERPVAMRHFGQAR